jgi:hypothetical protein
MPPRNFTINRGTTFGPILITATDNTGAVFPLAGYKAYAHVRKGLGGAITIDFAPVILPDDADGLITIPAIPFSITKDFDSGILPWDMILESPDGTRATDPILRGVVSISQLITQQ